MQSFTARVITIRDLTPDVRQIDLALLDPTEITFSAGQFVSFEIDRPLRRGGPLGPHLSQSSRRARSIGRRARPPLAEPVGELRACSIRARRKPIQITNLHDLASMFRKRRTTSSFASVSIRRVR